MIDNEKSQKHDDFNPRGLLKELVLGQEINANIIEVNKFVGKCWRKLVDTIEGDEQRKIRHEITEAFDGFAGWTLSFDTSNASRYFTLPQGISIRLKPDSEIEFIEPASVIIGYADRDLKQQILEMKYNDGTTGHWSTSKIEIDRQRDSSQTKLVLTGLKTQPAIGLMPVQVRPEDSTVHVVHVENKTTVQLDSVEEDYFPPSLSWHIGHPITKIN